MNPKYSSDSRPRRVDRGFSDAPATGIDYVGILNGTVKPTVNFNLELDDNTTKTIYVATGVLSASILLAAILNVAKK